QTLGTKRASQQIATAGLSIRVRIERRKSGKQAEPAQTEEPAGHQDDGAERQQRHGEIELGGDPTDLRAEIAVDLAELGLVGGVVVMAASRRADLLQRLFVDAVDNPA